LPAYFEVSKPSQSFLGKAFVVQVEEAVQTEIRLGV
jgi:hypothetical protein